MTLVLAMTACGDELPAATESASSTTTTTDSTGASTAGELPTTGDITTGDTTSTGPEPTTAVDPTTTTTDPTITTDPPVTTDHPQCFVPSDCEFLVSVPECRAVAGCDPSGCVFEDMPEGTPVSEQTAGDCKQFQCDGFGSLQLVDDDTDIEDDGVECTLDACEGGAPVHIPGMLSCYTGPPGTAGVGICLSGQQMCDVLGDPVGPCIGEVVPAPELCEPSLVDEDCDGQVNEEGAACVCVPNEASACYSGPPGTQGVGACEAGTHTCAGDGVSFGDCVGEVVPAAEDCDLESVDEDCDGQVNESGPSCVCGDGFVSAGEVCDDGNTEGGDACSADCTEKLAPLHVYVGGYHSCALFTGGRVKCWGWNSFGQLGLGDANHRGDQPGEMGAALPFVDLGLGNQAVDLAVGTTHTCALLVGGAIKCWGENGYGQLGQGDTVRRGDQPGEMGAALPFVNIGTTDVADIASGGYFTCAVLNDARLKCWGWNGNGALGLGNTNHRGDNPNEMGNALPFVDLGAGATVSALGVGDMHSCSVLTGGAVKCWGAGGNGVLGIVDPGHIGNEPGEMGNALVTVELTQPATGVGVTSSSNCITFPDGSIRCWGFNGQGELGLGDTDDRGDLPGEMGAAFPPVDVGAPVLSVHGGASLFCARTASHAVKCWGRNDEGNLGLGDTEDRGDQPGEMGANLPFVDFGAGRTVMELATSLYHSCALLDDGTVKCWGLNQYGGLGLGNTETRGDQPGEMGDALPTAQLL
ncbi:hypothetical protein [Nannocystis radixulma]|uniref:Myxococcus cysteine-rich repeat-containing protein n=1 Tax=Nannocystis radixulma TaxID=2995305 RepID=A0ABT5BE06_9BACT|nr:hypothetical protein [Nannocystis radixulma]MDC0672384.1 hypothetical protein [Nannocystis radixulma]